MNGGKLEGYGSYGIVFSNPRLPYYIKKDFNNDNNNIKNNLEEMKNIGNQELNFNNLKKKKEVSKLFKNKKSFVKEVIEYKSLIKLNILDKKHFNVPLNYGIINANFDKLKYNITWFELNQSNKLNSYHKFFNKNKTTNIKKNIYDFITYYQITFDEGIKINNNSTYDFFQKFKNIIEGVGILSKNNLFYDDLKINNILEINYLFKISDYSSIFNMNNLTMDIFDLSYLCYFKYYVYFPIYNLIIYYNLHNNIALKNNLTSYYLTLNKDDYKTNINLIISNIIKKYSSINIGNMEINVIQIENINAYTEKKINLNLNVYDCLIRIHFIFNVNNSSNVRNQQSCHNTIYHFLNYIDQKFNNNIDKNIYLLNKNMLFSCGMIILEYLYVNEIDDSIYVINLLKIFILCCSTIISINGNKYLNNSKIEDIFSLYNTLNKKRKNRNN